MQVSSFVGYLSRVRRYSPHTVSAYRDDLVRFLDFFGWDEETADFASLTTKQIRMWLVAEMRGDLRKDFPGKPLSPASGKRKLSSVNAFFRYLVKEGVLEKNLAALISGPKVGKRLPVYVRQEQMGALLEACPVEEEAAGFSRVRDRLILLVAYEAGLRRSEISGLRLEDVDFSRRCLRVRGKGGRLREIPAIDELLEDMREYLTERGKVVTQEHGLFFVTDKGRPVYDQFIYRLVVRELGEHTTLSKRSPHVLRHTFATHLLQSGATIQGIRELLGHSSLAATQVYTHNSVENMLTIFKQAHPRA